MDFGASLWGPPLAAFVATKLSGGGKKTNKNIEGLTEQQKEASEFALGEARENLGQARDVLQGPLEFFQTLLGGDRGAMLETLAPEIGSVVGQFDTARKNVAQFAPRGGGRSAQLGESQFKVADIITRLLAESRRGAAGQVAAIGGQLGALGTAELGIGTGTISNLINSLLGKRGQDIDVQTSLGQGIGRLLAQLLDPPD